MHRLGFLTNLGVGAVTVFAVLRRGAVVKNLLAFEIAKQFVAVAAAHILVRALERETGALFVIKR